MSLLCSLERAASAGAVREKPPASDNRSRDRTGNKFTSVIVKKEPHLYFSFADISKVR